MSTDPASMARTGLLIVDLQNDFLHADGAYARGGQRAAAIKVLPAKLQPLADVFRKAGGWIISTHFTLVPGKQGEPMISPHLKSLRPFLRKGDFAPGSWGHALVDELCPSDLQVEKIAYSAFYMTRLEWLLRKSGIERLVVGGIVSNGGVASTVRDAHVRDIETVVLADGCAAFDDATHQTAIAALKPVARIATIAEMLAETAL
jgi:ureidoacrylate peracid hydrolase